MDERVLNAIERMRCDLRHPTPVTRLADRSELSASRFAHLFTAQVGESPARYLKRLRMERARELLETTGFKVKRIAFEVGAGDVSHFVRDFTRCYGVTPTGYRLAHYARPPARAVAAAAHTGGSRIG